MTKVWGARGRGFSWVFDNATISLDYDAGQISPRAQERVNLAEGMCID